MRFAIKQEIKDKMKRSTIPVIVFNLESKLDEKSYLSDTLAYFITVRLI